ncbi:MAG: hypothetical protein M3Q56_06805 [Bacteroidota bacterium]|nr:hypothetical protein [Bacteroidota bacterium]
MKNFPKIIVRIVLISLLFCSCNSVKYKKETHDENGVLETREFYENGKLVQFISFYPNGVKQVERFYDKKTGLMSGPYFEYYESGAIMKRGNATAGELEDTVLVYYPNNKIQEIEIYKRGIKHGDLIYFHPNGQVGAIGKYVNDSLDGRWLIYDNDGKKVAIKEYSLGKLIKIDSVKDHVDANETIDPNAVEIRPK